jgi:hypothetical protein
LAPDQVGCERRQSIKLIFRKPRLDQHILAFDKARVFQTLAKCSLDIPKVVGRSRIKKSDYWQHRLLRLRARGLNGTI